MEELSLIIDQKACSGAGGANTGKLGCLSLFGEPTHFMLITKGTVIPKATVFDLTYLSNMVQIGKNVPLIDASAFEDLSAEDTMSTNSKGIERLNLKGLPKYKFTFEEGHEFYREISKLTSFKSKDVIIGDEEGNWMLAKNSDGDFTGFTVGQITALLRKTKMAGGDAESKSITIQFLDRLQIDTNYGILHADTLDWTPQEIPLVNGVNLVAAPIADAGTDLVVTAKLSQDNNTIVEGLILADFVVTKNGTSEVPSGVVETTPGVYTITVAAAATNDIYIIDLYDSTKNVDIINSNDILYRSDGVSVTTT